MALPLRALWPPLDLGREGTAGGLRVVQIESLAQGAEGEAVTEEDERRYKMIRGCHGQVARSGEQPFCGWCGTLWPCHAAFLLGVIDAMKDEHALLIERGLRMVESAERIRDMLARGKDE